MIRYSPRYPSCSLIVSYLTSLPTQCCICIDFEHDPEQQPTLSESNATLVITKERDQEIKCWHRISLVSSCLYLPHPCTINQSITHNHPPPAPINKQKSHSDHVIRIHHLVIVVLEANDPFTFTFTFINEINQALWIYLSEL